MRTLIAAGLMVVATAVVSAAAPSPAPAPASSASAEAGPGSAYSFLWQGETGTDPAGSESGRTAARLGAYHAPNPGAVWDAAIGETGLRLRSMETAAGSAGSWEVGLSLSGFGVAGKLQTPGAATHSARENQLVVRHEGLTTAYTNGLRGLEQMITLSRPQDGGSMEALISFDVSLAGGLFARRDPGGSEIAFVRPNGEIALLYSLERATGASARFELLRGSTSNSHRLWIVLDGAGGAGVLEVELRIHRNTELEPNDEPAHANALGCGIEGGTGTAGDAADEFAIDAPAADARLFAAIETIGGGAEAFRMRLVAPDADTAPAREGQDAGGGAFTGAGSPVRAVTRLLGGSAATLRVEAASSAAGSERYRLYAVAQPPVASATEEAEPNDAPGEATRSSNDYYTGHLASPKDVDNYSFRAAAGDLLFIGLDTDRDRDGQAFAGTLTLTDAKGSVLASASEPSSHDVGLVYRAATDGTYFVRISGELPADIPERSDYLLSISRNCQSASIASTAGGIGTINTLDGTRSGTPRTSVNPPEDAYSPYEPDSSEDTLFAPPSEINDSVRVTKAGANATISWTDSPGPYNVYKGSRAAASPWTYNHSCFASKLAGSSTIDGAVPSPGGLFYYLVTRQATCEESIAGRDSSNAQIPDLGQCVPPGQGPPPAKPYFMVIVDNSGSMGTAISGSNNSCGYQNNRLGHARCAVRNMVNAYAGQVNFGLATYAWRETSCLNQACGTCDAATGCFPAQCTASFPPSDNNLCGAFTNEPTLSNLQIHSGLNVAVPMLQDHYWQDPPDASNLSSLINLVDNNCGNSEIGAASQTPLGGALFSMNKYFSGTFTDAFSGAPVATPIGPMTQGGLPAERSCRSINVILLTDGDESCDFYNTGTYPNGEGLAVYEAGRLFNTGVTISGQTFKIKTYVVGFVGATTVALNNIANAGGTSTSLTTANETQLTTALGSIVTGALSAEKCDNLDNNCNGCVDEGYRHFRNVQPVPGSCCTWANMAQRASCINTYLTSITPANPQGNRALLPCTTAAQQLDSATWLCYDPGDTCDSTDNNGDGGIDEGQIKCGSPAHCPFPETCNGLDDNCNGAVDEGGVCPNGCVVTPEVCDGCDNDCDGVADNSISGSSSCGLPFPANCVGTRTCKPPVAVPPGGCNPSGGYNTCSNNPQPEVCDSVDNDCNGAVDDAEACPCAQRQEICNGLDDNCNGPIDEGVTPPPVSQVCGVNPGATAPECTSQVTLSCVGGAWQCTFPAGVCNGAGGCSGTAEICDTLDNNCDGRLNENVPSFGKACASDDATPGSDGPCRTTGSFVCNGPSAVQCSAVKANCATLPAGCTELCDGIDNDCDGFVDETFQAKGANPTFFVKPAATKIGNALWIYSEEASRANATTVLSGNGNGYFTSAPSGSTLDKTKPCSTTNKLPWNNVTGTEGEQACTAVGGHLCTQAELQNACTINPPGPTTCTWGYQPSGAACTSAATPTKYCNLGPTYDYSPAIAGDQDGLLPTASVLLQNCNADWAVLFGNGGANGRIHDVTGNLREMAKVTTNQYVLLGGAFNSASEAGSTCQFTFYNVNQTYQSIDTGFRCCFSADPRQ